MHLDGVLGTDALLGEEDGSAISLVSLQLNDLAELGVFDDRAVAQQRVSQRPRTEHRELKGGIQLALSSRLRALSLGSDVLALLDLGIDVNDAFAEDVSKALPDIFIYGYDCTADDPGTKPSQTVY